MLFLLSCSSVSFSIKILLIICRLKIMNKYNVGKNETSYCGDQTNTDCSIQIEVFVVMITGCYVTHAVCAY